MEGGFIPAHTGLGKQGIGIGGILLFVADGNIHR